MAMDPGIMVTDTINLNGTVTDDEGNPINHIRITLEWDDQAFSPLTVYTSTNGEFYADLDFYYLRYPTTVLIGLSDPDGPENGGEFAAKTDAITIDEAGPLKPITCRLTRATASESSPQSL
jgi:hypothetical protein